MFHSAERPGVWADPEMFDWREALHRPGAGQVGLLKGLAEQYGPFEASAALLEAPPPNSRAVRAGENILVYLPEAGEVKVRGSEELKGVWFDPRDGSRTEVSPQAPFVPPAENTDWVLILEPV